MSAEQSSVNSETIEQTKQQIRSLVSEISQLSKSDIGAEQYYASFLQRVVQALAAVGGAIWLFGEGRRLQLTYQINLSETLLDSASEDASRHTRLLNYTAQTNEGHLIPPLSGASDERAGGNPTRYLLVITPLRGDGQVEGLVEIFQRPDSPPATQRGYLRFLEQMTELAGEWLKTQKLRLFSDRHSLWAQADHFSRLVHESLDLRETAYAVANEGRRLIGCDRVSVAIMRGRKCVVEAVSGQDTLESRSNVVALLGQLATKVVATGDPLWYEGSTEDFPPQIEKSIEEYVDESYTKSLVVLPLRKPKSADETARAAAAGEVERDQHRAGEVIGALIIEQIESELPRAIIAPRMDLVYEHSARALANSMDFNNLFLMPVWRALGQAAWVVKARTLPKTLAIAGLVLLVIGTLTFVKKDFYLKSTGELQPVDRRQVFVNVGGMVERVLVEDQQFVEAGEVLAELSNTDLEVQWQDVVGQMLSTREQLASAVDAQIQGRQGNLSEADKLRIVGQINDLTKRLESLERQRDLLEEKREQLKVRSPISGQVLMSWEVERSLMNRTVEVGQVLMSVADLSRDWEVQLFVPERRMGHIDDARVASGDEPLRVSYILATDPKTTHTGFVQEVQRITQVHEEDGNTVRLKVAINKSDISDPRPGSTVRGKVLCGRRAIGYTWFHEAIEWVQANVLF
jgi:multidrug efflux pump subunit AcrA (membrane-fusion protein)